MTKEYIYRFEALRPMLKQPDDLGGESRSKTALKYLPVTYLTRWHPPTEAQRQVQVLILQFARPGSMVPPAPSLSTATYNCSICESAV